LTSTDRAGLRGPASSLVAFVLAFLLAASPARAFVYSEHRAIAGAAIQGLNPEHAAVLARLWSLARASHEDRLCADPYTGPQGLALDCIDLAAWSAIGGDHSCSPQDLLAQVLEGAVILKKEKIAAAEAEGLAEAERDSQRRNASATAQIAMARADPEYATRAGSNNSHFLLYRTSGGEDILGYLDDALDSDSEANSAASYFLYHGAAMELAARTDPSATGTEAAARARLILALESFAEHFLEDMFAAGHVAGSWGTVAERKGTHDFYNRAGLEVWSWDGTETVLFGDAFLRPDGLERAAQVVRQSLEQVLDAYTEGTPARIAALAADAPADVLEGRYDNCRSTKAPDWDVPERLEPWFEAVAMRMPVPFRGAGPGSLPRVHGEIGPYAALVAGGSLAGSGGSYDGLDTGGTLIDSLTLGVRLGLGLEELLTDSGDGLIFLEGGVSMSSSEPTDCPECESGRSNIFPRVPARSGIETRFRAPFFVVPGDLILAAPILLLTAPEKFTKMASVAATGGLIPYERRIHTPVGRFQFMLGREAGATFYGYTGGLDELVTLNPDDPDELIVVGFKSVTVEIPAIEWEPFRFYGSRQALGIRFQFGAGFDKPLSATVLDPPGAPLPDLQTRYFGFLRMIFEGRRYF
jgi:hypothetical protein